MKNEQFIAIKSIITIYSNLVKIDYIISLLINKSKFLVWIRIFLSKPTLTDMNQYT